MVFGGIRHCDAAGFADEYKNFTSSPPPIEKLLFQKSFHARGTTKVTYYEARWQDGNFVIRGTEDPQALGKPLTESNIIFAGAYGSNVWSGSQSTLDYTVKGAMPGHWVESARQIGLINLGDVLNLGISKSRIGSIKWSGDSFTAIARIPDGEAFSGKLTLDSKGRPARVDYLGTPDGSIKVTVDYSYLKPLEEPGLPSHISFSVTKLQADGSWFFSPNLMEFDILSINLAKEVMPESMFLPDSYFAEPGPRQVSRLVGGILQYSLADNVSFSVKPTDILPVAGGNLWGIVVMVVAIGGLVVICVAFKRYSVG